MWLCQEIVSRIFAHYYFSLFVELFCGRVGLEPEGLIEKKINVRV